MATEQPIAESPALDLDCQQTYAYQHLDESKNEIRLVTILPGSYDDHLEITLDHVSLSPLPMRSPPKTLSLENLRETLPPRWNVFQTSEGRMLFKGPDETTTWVHPNSHVIPTAYDVTLQPTQDTGDTPDFEALSYTWGPLSPSATVTVRNGVKSSTSQKPSVLQIGANLSEALRHLRLREEGRLMWIDALCINQDDLEERGRQVRHMAHIYRRARKVVAWLGPERDNVVKAMQGLHRVGEQVEITTNYLFASSPGASEPTWHDPKEPVPFDNSLWAAIIGLINRPWFSRLWVIQEIHMGNIKSFLQCGTHEIPWSLFWRAVRCLAVKGQDFPARPYFARLLPMCSIAYGNYFDYVLSTLGAHHHCSDPRDIIYGIMSLAPPELQEALYIDYRLDIQLVYKQFFATYSHLQQRSDLLIFAGWPVPATKTASQLWPSWVPDWRGGAPSLHSLLYSCASASGQSCSEMVSGAERQNSLRIKGVFLDDTISTLLIKDIGNLAEVLEKFTTLVGRCQIETAHRYIDAMHQGLTADRFANPPVWAQPRERLRQDVFHNPGFSLESKENLPSWWLAYKSFVDYWWPGTKLFLTSRGHPGVCKWEVQSGEAIFIPLGCVSPIAVRPVGNRGTTFQAVGPVYLNGVMDGEAFLGQLPDHWCVQYDMSDENVKNKVLYKNLKTGTGVTRDPRLDKVPLPQQWEPLLDWTRESIDPRVCCRFRNKLTGKLINYDPRMTSEALKERDINITEIVLV